MMAARSLGIFFGVVTVLGTLMGHVLCNEETHLISDLFKGYNKNIRPVFKPEDKVEVQIKLTLTNLISLNEKEETLTTNVWIEIQWNDYRLSWNTTKYYGIDIIRVPCKTVWLPDIVLENNIDGKFDVAYYANVLISSDGSMYWLPPAIYRSTCAIEITYFPFDYQNCTLAFRLLLSTLRQIFALGGCQDGVWMKSQTYSANEVNLTLAVQDGIIEWVDIDPEAFTENGEWAIVHRPARKMINLQYSPEDLEYQEIIFNLIIQRKPLFYIINIILPCSLISSLVVLAYFLPAQAGGQKLTVSISVLLAQTVFLFLIAQKIPETSLSVPLIGKYLIFVMCVTTLIATNQIVVLNFSLRSPSTHTMSYTIKHMFLEMVPRFLGMSPLVDDSEVPAEVNGMRERRRSSFGLMQRAEEYVLKQPRSEMMFDKQRERHGLTRSIDSRLQANMESHDKSFISVVEDFSPPPSPPPANFIDELDEEDDDRDQVIYGVQPYTLISHNIMTTDSRHLKPLLLVRERCRLIPAMKLMHPNVDNVDISSTANLYKSLAQAAPEIKQCVDACNFIAESTRQQNDIGSEIESWVLIGKMIDKVCFWAAILLFIFGTVGIFLTGHFNRAPEFPFPGETKSYTPS